MSQNNIDYMNNTKEVLASVACKYIVSAHGAAISQNGEYVCMLSFISILLIICFPNVSNKTYHDTGYNKLYAETMGVLVHKPG